VPPGPRRPARTPVRVPAGSALGAPGRPSLRSPRDGTPAVPPAGQGVEASRAGLGRWGAALAVAAAPPLLVGGVGGLVAGALAGAACWWATGRLETPAQRRARERLAAAVPHVVDLVAACLTAGLSPLQALEQVRDAVEAPARDELAVLVARLRMGVDPVTVWRDLGRHPQLGGLGRSLARATESGSSVAEAMERLSDDLRRQSRADVESRARAVGVKAAVPLGLCLLPAFVLVGVVPLVVGSLSVLTGR